MFLFRGRRRGLTGHEINHGDEKYSIGNTIKNIVITLCGDKGQLHLLW